MFDLTGKTALVTGASGGIGAAIARTLHGQGAVVVLSGTRAAALEGLAAELGERAHVCPADLRDAAAADALVGQAEEQAGPLHILVNNAGFTRDMLALRMQDADWQSVLDVDLSAPFRLIRASLRGMLKRRAGRIINIASIVGVTGNAGQANYSAAKAGIIGFTRSLARELAPSGITVNAICPGPIDTDLSRTNSAEWRAELVAQMPVGRYGEVEEIAPTAVLLASNEGSFYVGATLNPNGGDVMA